MELPLSPAARANAYVYLRKSRDKREQVDPDTLRRHRRALLQCAAEDGIEIPVSRQYEEIGSGETIAGRPGFRRLLDAWRLLPAGAGGIAYVMDVDRLSRGILTERGQVQDLLLKAGILIRTPAELIDLRQPAQGLLYEIKGSLARHELLIYKARVAATRRDQLRRGQIRNARVPLGYDWDRNSELPVANDRFPLLQALCRDALLLSVNRLAAKYSLHRSVVYDTLTNPTICGWPARRHVYDPEIGSRRVARDRWLWPEQPGTYPAACSRADWEQIQARLTDRSTWRSKTIGTDGWCRDVVKFAGHEERRVRLGTYNATATYELPVPGAPMLYVRREPIHAAVQDALLARLDDRQAVSRALDQYRCIQSSEPTRIASGGDLPALQQEAAGREEELARLLRRELTADADDAASIRAVRREIKAELAALQGQIQAITGSAPSAAAAGPLLELLTQIDPATWPAFWGEELDEETRRSIVRGLIRQAPVRIEDRGKFKTKKRILLPLVWHPWLDLGE